MEKNGTPALGRDAEANALSAAQDLINNGFTSATARSGLESGGWSDAQVERILKAMHEIETQNIR